MFPTLTCVGGEPVRLLQLPCLGIWSEIVCPNTFEELVSENMCKCVMSFKASGNTHITWSTRAVKSSVGQGARTWIEGARCKAHMLTSMQ